MGHPMEDVVAEARAEQTRRAAEVPLPSVGRVVHYYGQLVVDHPEVAGAQALVDGGPFAALVVDVTEPTTVTLKITDRQGRDHVRANVKHGDPGWMWPPRV